MSKRSNCCSLYHFSVLYLRRTLVTHCNCLPARSSRCDSKSFTGSCLAAPDCSMNTAAAAKRRRGNPVLIDDFVARPALLYGFQIALKQLEVVFSTRHSVSLEINALNAAFAIGSRVCHQNRQVLINGGRLCSILAQRLLCFDGHCAFYHPLALRPGTSVLSRRHFFNNSSAPHVMNYVARLESHGYSVNSVAFHPTAPLLATGSDDNTVKLWLLSSDNSSATCVATLAGHSSSVRSVAFHPTAPLLATGSGDDDETVRLWR